MSIADPNEKHHEIVIVRRGHGDHDEGHHGGVWKIAFADFMTAMMCFFLVMWLINASNEETKAAVASYFNPVKLVDRNAARKSLEDEGDGPEQAGSAAEKNSEGGDSKAGRRSTKAPSRVRRSRRRPTQNCSPIPMRCWPRSPPTPASSRTSARRVTAACRSPAPPPAPRAAKPTATRSPRISVAAGGAAERGRGQRRAEAHRREHLRGTAGENRNIGKGAAFGECRCCRRQAAPGVASDAAVPGSRIGKARRPSGGKTRTAVGKAEPTPDTVEGRRPDPPGTGRTIAAGRQDKDGISVVATDKGVQVSVTDQLEFGMFEIGSALPRRELVLAMEKISQAIGKQKGTVNISGHTDARPYKAGGYDNWRLSTARAHSAYYMLVRARPRRTAYHRGRRLRRPQAQGRRRPAGGEQPPHRNPARDRR